MDVSLEKFRKEGGFGKLGEQYLAEEKKTDETLTKIAEARVNQKAA